MKGKSGKSGIFSSRDPFLTGPGLEIINFNETDLMQENLTEISVVEAVLQGGSTDVLSSRSLAAQLCMGFLSL